MKVQAFIVHLARATGRAPQVERLCKDLPLPAEVLDAVDGRRLSDEELNNFYTPRLRRPTYPFTLRNSEIACFLSHRKAWAEIVDRGLDAGLVLEDDVAIDPAQFSIVLDLALSCLKSHDFIRFPKNARGENGSVVAETARARLVLPRRPRLGMQAQLVSRNAAGALLEFTSTFDRPVDTMIQMQWLHQVRVLTAMPVVIREESADLGGTTVQGTVKPLTEILARELQRARYRLVVAVFNTLHSYKAG